MMLPWTTSYKTCPLAFSLEDWFNSWDNGLISKDWYWCNGDCIRNPIKW